MKKKEELLLGIADLFFEKGYDKTSIRDISSTLNISKPGLYFHFENKQQMLYELIYDFLSNSNQTLKEALATAKDSDEKLLIIIKRHIESFVEHPSQVKVMIYEAHSLEGEYASRFKALENEYIDIIRGVLKPLLKGRLRSLDMNVATFSLLGTLNWIIKWYDPQKKVPPQKLIKQISRFFLRGIGIDAK